CFCFLLLPPPMSTLFPYTTLFRSLEEAATRHGGFHVVFVCTFSLDEPVETVAEVARRLPEVTFSFTGDPYYAPRGFAMSLPPNRSEERRVGKECRTRAWKDH